MVVEAMTQQQRTAHYIADSGPPYRTLLTTNPHMEKCAVLRSAQWSVQRTTAHSRQHPQGPSKVRRCSSGNRRLSSMRNFIKIWKGGIGHNSRNACGSGATCSF